MGILEIINKGYLLVLALLLTACNKDKKLFTLLSSDQTG
jgi:hypothetical protein